MPPVAKTAPTTGSIRNYIDMYVNPIKGKVSAKVEFMQYSGKKLLAWIFSA